MPPFVSVIIPVYRAERTLKALVDSLRAQDYQTDAFEVLLVTDPKGGNGSLSLAKRLATTSAPVVRVIEDPKPGSAAHRNLGVASANPRTQYLAFTDSDCRVPPHWLPTLVAAVEKAPKKVIAVGGLNPAPPDDPPLAQVIGIIEGSVLGGGTSSQVRLAKKVREVPSLPNCNALYRREAWQKEQQDEALIKGQDGEFNYRLARRGYRFLQTPATFVWHHRPATLREHAKRMHDYGAATLLIARKHPRILATRWYATTAVSFVLGLVLLALLGLVWAPALLAAGLLFLAYLLGVLVVTATVVVRYPKPAALWTPFLLFLVHFGYAAGFWRECLLSRKER